MSATCLSGTAARAQDGPGVLKDGRSHESKGIGRGQGVKGRDGKFKSKDDTLESVAMPCTTEAIKNPVMAAFFTRDDSPQAA